MADVIYKKGQSSNLDNVQIKEGQILVTEDTGEMYVDVTNSDRKKINPQADWQQNDETANNYIKNRPGGYIDNDTIVKIPEKYLDIKNTNIVNGSKTGSLRTIGSKEEDSSYKLGKYAMAEGLNTIASSECQHVQGKFNIEDANGEYLDIIGNGTASKRSNAATIDKNGNAWFSSDVYTGSNSGTHKDSGSRKLATEKYVDDSKNDRVVVKGNGANSIKHNIDNSIANGSNSIALGWGNQSLHSAANVFGVNNKSSAEYQSIFGTWCKENPDALFILGNGTSGINRSNLFEITNTDVIHNGVALPKQSDLQGVDNKISSISGRVKTLEDKNSRGIVAAGWIDHSGEGAGSSSKPFIRYTFFNDRTFELWGRRIMPTTNLTSPFGSLYRSRDVNQTINLSEVHEKLRNTTIVMNNPTVALVSASCSENTIIVGTTYATTEGTGWDAKTEIRFCTMCPDKTSNANIYARFYCWGVWTPKN